MFSGIVQATSKVISTAERGACKAVTIERPRGWKLAKGQSISLDGICSTVVRFNAKSFEVEYMPETLSKTTAGDFNTKSVLNLERSLTLRDYVDGHMVMGHVDSRVRVKSFDKQKNSALLTIELPATLRKFVARHGSVTLNGVSLTVARKGASTCAVALIPHTLSHTNLGTLKPGSWVNIEVDVVARYVVEALGDRSTMTRHAKQKSRRS